MPTISLWNIPKKRERKVGQKDLEKRQEERPSPEDDENA